MNVLVATSKTQGQRKNDFCHTEEGELVGFSFECDGEAVDGPCGCRRAMSGLESLKGTTTMIVEDRDMTREEFEAAVRAGLDAGGWLELMKDDADEMVRSDTDDLLRLAEALPAGIVIEKRGNQFRARE